MTAEAPRPYGPLEHYREDVDESCSCDTCISWRRVRDEYVEVRSLVVKHANDCACDDCRRRYAVRSEYLAACNRRDVWCEMSFHVANTVRPRWRDDCMTWLGLEIERHDKLGRNWWEITAPTLPVDYWLLGFVRAFSGMVSGSAGGVRNLGVG